MKIVVLSYESLYSSMMIAHLLQARPGQVVGIVLSSCIVQGKGLPGSLWHVLRRAGPEFFIRKSLETVEYKAVTALWRLLRRPRHVLGVTELARQHNVPVTESADVNQPETLNWIRARQPDLVISVYLNQWIGDSLLALPAKGCVNIHPALLPRHRGLFPYFWVLAHGERETGVTVHFVERQFDTGGILRQQTVDVTSEDTIQSLSYKSAVVGGPLLVGAVDDIAAGTVSGKPQGQAGASYHSWPTSDAYRRFRKAGRHFGSVRELVSYL
jgi:folate-dependent phosphoribosylglycinamide formyltransferase PurN